MRTIGRVLTLSMVAVCAVGSSACLRRTITHTLYIAPASVTWSAVESGVRSDEREAAARAAEEHDYVLAARAGRQPIATALRRLGARSVETTWLRSERPYAVMTEGRFADLRQLALAVLGDTQIAGDASLVRDGCKSTFAVRANVDSATAATDESAANALMEGLGAYRLVLTAGLFVSADGFAIEQDGAVAVPDGKKAPADGVLTLGLTWIDEDCDSPAR